LATLIPVVALYFVTLVHHLYGGILLVSTERLLLAAIFTIVIGMTVWLHRRGRVRLWARIGYGVLAGLWVVVIGLVGGGYNHALFVVLNSRAPVTTRSTAFTRRHRRRRVQQ
jgi:hypothetical protein